MDDLRLVLVEWCPCCRANFGIGLDSTHCSRYKTHGGWLQGLTVLDSQELSSYVPPELRARRRRSSVSLRRRYAHGTCFRNVLLGHNSALSVSYFHPSRAMIAREFRDSYLRQLGLSAVIKGPGFRRVNQFSWRQRVHPPRSTFPPPPSLCARPKMCRWSCTRKRQG
jgi:hypothetical protein